MGMSELHARRWTRPGILQAFVSCLLAVGLMLEPWGVQRNLTTGLRDSLLPGQWMLVQLEESLDHWTSHLWSPTTIEQQHHEMRAELKAVRHSYRQLEIAHATLDERMRRTRRQGVSPYQASSGLPLLVPELVTARVFGREYRSGDRADRLLDLQMVDGAIAGDLVLSAQSPILDQGAQEDVRIGQPVYSGATVVGRIASVGRWISTVQPVTDPDYRGRAQLARTTEHGVVFTAEGMLRGGAGGSCALRGIKATEAVAVGDRVYTGGRSGTLPYPMYYGKVSHVELELDAEEWRIEVDPAVDWEQVQSVQVLRDSLNPVRILGQ